MSCCGTLYKPDEDHLVDAFLCEKCNRTYYTSTGEVMYYRKRHQLGKYEGVRCYYCAFGRAKRDSLMEMQAQLQDMAEQLLAKFEQDRLKPYYYENCGIYSYYLVQQPTTMELQGYTEITAEYATAHISELLILAMKLEDKELKLVKDECGLIWE